MVLNTPAHPQIFSLCLISWGAESVPRKRIGSPEDIAGLCMYLCSRAGAYTIGETITCDGGLAKLL